MSRDEQDHEARALQAALREFWDEQAEEISQVGREMQEFKNHQLPLARIKKIMKSDEDVRMISAEAPVLFAKACEMFILELTLRAWHHAEEGRRRTLQRSDVAAAISKTDILDFLLDIVPQEDLPKDGEGEGGGGGAPSTSGAGSSGGGGGPRHSDAGVMGLDGGGGGARGQPDPGSVLGAVQGGPLDAMFAQAQQTAALMGLLPGGGQQP